MLVFFPDLWVEFRYVPAKPVSLPTLPQTKRVS